jgi:hypothetical protein
MHAWALSPGGVMLANLIKNLDLEEMVTVLLVVARVRALPLVGALTYPA